MSEIKKGDLAYVAQATLCCGNSSGVGQIFVVGEIYTHTAFCSKCGQSFTDLMTKKPNGTYTEIYRLKKIDPPATGEYDGVAVRKTQPKKVTV